MTASDSFWLKVWDFVADAGYVAVIFGVIGEGAELLLKWVKKRRRPEKRTGDAVGAGRVGKMKAICVKGCRALLACVVKFVRPRLLKVEGISFMVLVIGLGTEFFGAKKARVITDRENAVLNERAANTESNNLVLVQQVNETKAQLAKAETRLNETIAESLPMDIGEQFSLAAKLKSFGGMGVELRTVMDVRAEQTAEDLLAAFAFGGWTVINRAILTARSEEGIAIGHCKDDTSSKNAAYFLLRLLTERNVPSDIVDDVNSGRVRGVPTNAILVAICKRPSQLKEQWMLVQAKQKILRHEMETCSMRIQELGSKRFASHSKEFSDAQAEYDNLQTQFSAARKEQESLSTQAEKLLNELLEADKKRQGTNSFTTASGGTIFGRGNRVNPPPFE